MTRVLFVYPNAVLQNPPPVSMALFYALLKNIAGVDVRIFDTTLYDTESITSDKTRETYLQVRPFDFQERKVKLKDSNVYQDFIKMVEVFDPDILALSCNEITYNQGVALLGKVKEHQSLKIVGGVYSTFAPEEILKNDFIDIVCIGEGEGAIVEIVKTFNVHGDMSTIRNTWVRKNGFIIRNPLRELVDLNLNPIPDYTFFEESRYYRPMAGKIWKLFPIETSRGCPYSCSYCNSPSQAEMYRRCGQNNYFRKKSIDKIGKEIADVVNNYGAEYIYFLSDTLLALNDSEFDEFCKMYSKYSLPFWCQNRPEMITYERMKKLKELGCHRMSIGVEHGNEEFRWKVLNKKVRNETIIKAFEMIDRVGIPVSINNMVGFPGETRELVFDTIELNRKLKCDASNAYAFTPFHGTELYELCLMKGYIDDSKERICVTKGSILDMPQLSRQEIDGLVKTFSLYTKMPREYFSKIERAEKDDEIGNKIFNELSKEYKKLFFS